MKLSPWQKKFGFALVALSGVLYLTQYLIFRTPRNISYYFFQDLAFLPIEVLLVTVILHGLLTARERRERMRKMNMVIGAFFAEVGTDLIERYFSFLRDYAEIGDHLRIDAQWSGKRFDSAVSEVRNYSWDIDSRRSDLGQLKSFLAGKRMFLLRLLENPNLLEHDTFTDLLWAVFHLSDELDHRPELGNLPESDCDHLSIDMRRAFTVLVVEWLAYLRHLKNDYPYLFSLAVRTNPFDPGARVTIG